MKKDNPLDRLPKEYFAQKFTTNVMPSGLLWGFFLCCIFFTLVTLTVGADDDFPSWSRICCYAIAALHGLYIIPCFFFSSKKLTDRHLPGYIFFTAAGAWIFQLNFWIVFTILALALTGVTGIDEAGSLKNAISFIAAMMVLLCGVIINVLMVYRMRHRIIGGHFRKGGSGFWGDSKHVKIIAAVLSAISPALMSFGSASVLFGKYKGIIWDEIYAPVAMIIAPLLSGAAFFVLGYANAYLLMRIYYIKRFGSPECRDTNRYCHDNLLNN